MASILELIKIRQSTRKYLTTPVKRETIEKCLLAAQLSPSACNSQPWHFIAIDEPDLKNKLCDKIFSGPYQMNAFAKEAPVIVVIVSEKTPIITRIGGFLRGTAYYLIDIGIAGEHFVLAAQELGLGTCWIGWFNEKEAKKILNIPRDKKIACVISLGYPKEDIRPKNRKPLEDMSSFNRYKSEKI